MFRLDVSSRRATSLADWDKPEILALCQGPQRPWQIYAAGRGLYVSDATQPDDRGPTVWYDVSKPGIGKIFDVCVTDNGFVLLACYTGLWVSPIPPQGNPTAYNFTQVPAVAGQICNSVAAGVSGGFSLGLFGGATSAQKGLRVGTVSASGVVVTRTNLAASGTDVSEAGIAWLTRSWEVDRRRMYAAAEGPGGGLEFVYRSYDGGQTWTACNTATTRAGMSVAQFAGYGAGVKGYVQAIAIAPNSGDKVYVGWRSEVPMISTDAGNTWMVPAGYSPVPGVTVSPTIADHVHADLHALVCDPDDLTGNTVWIGSDGGVCVSRDACATFDSQTNRELYNLEFQANPGYTFPGGSGVDYHHDGVVGGGLQDNGVVTSTLFTPQNGWRQIEGFPAGGDGFRAVFLRTGTLLYSSNARSGVWQATYKTGGQFTKVGQMNWPTARTGPDERYTVFEIVNDPRTERDGRVTYAVGGVDNVLAVLMGDQAGGALTWEVLTTLPLRSGDRVSAVASGSGAYIFVGTQQGDVFVFGRDGKNLKQQRLLNADNQPDDGLKAWISRFLIQDDDPAHPFVLAAGGARVFQYSDGPATPPFGGGFYVLGRGPKVGAGTGLPDPSTADLGIIRAIDTDWLHQPKPIYVAFDHSVWISLDDANHWQRCNIGLPQRPYVADLRFVSQSTGEHWLYIFSFARALWRARVA